MTGGTWLTHSHVAAKDQWAAEDGPQRHLRVLRAGRPESRVSAEKLKPLKGTCSSCVRFVMRHGTPSGQLPCVMNPSGSMSCKRAARVSTKPSSHESVPSPGSCCLQQGPGPQSYSASAAPRGSARAAVATGPNHPHCKSNPQTAISRERRLAAEACARSRHSIEVGERRNLLRHGQRAVVAR